MKIMACVSIIALGLGMAGTASAAGPHTDYDALVSMSARTNPDTTDGERTRVLPSEEDAHDTLTGGPSGGLPGRS